MLGTAAVQQPQLVGEAVERFGADRIVAGLDARDGRVATHGWQETTGLTAVEVARRMADLGVLRTVYTDISRDGMLAGVNVGATVELARASGLRVIASGGAGSLDDIRAIGAAAASLKAEVRPPTPPAAFGPVSAQDAPRRAGGGIEGVIVGQALYTGAFRLPDALALAGEA